MDFASNTRNPRRLGVAGLATLFALLSGCFTEPAGVGATDGSCDPGSELCPCVEGSCLQGLVCTPSDICVDDDCRPGSMYCDCEGQGLCGAGLECDENDRCTPQGTTTVPPTSSDSNTSTGTSSTTGTSTSSSTMPSTTAVDTTTTDPDTTDATESTTTDEPLSCAESAAGGTAQEVCEDCFLCTNANECGTTFDACEEIDGCLVAAQCLQQCAVAGNCFEDCCEGENPTFQAAALAMHNCREATCSQGACRSFGSIPGFCGA